MTLTAKRMAAVAAVNLILISCSSAPPAPQKGTPAFHWTAARETYAAGDYLQTIENLDRIVATENEFTAKARPWLLIMTSGMGEGYMELADYYEGGARINKSNPLAFRKQVSNYRGAAGRMALRFAEVVADFQKGKDDPVALAFPYPNGSPGLVAQLAKVGSGILPAENEAESGQKTALLRSVLLATCRAAGNPGDTARTQEMFKAGEVKVPRAAFLLATAHSLYQGAELYTSMKLDQPDKIKIFCGRAQEALKMVPESKDRKELDTKIEAALKKIKS